MGTNYYIRENECDKCGRYDAIHLGKSSYGWQFSFQYNGGQYYRNVREMKEWLADKTIKNEYGEEISHKDFWNMVKEQQKKPNLNHARYAKERGYEPDQYIVDGYSFTDHEFS